MLGMMDSLKRPPPLGARTCECCGKYFTPQNYVQQICGQRDCFLGWLNNRRREDPNFATRPRIPLGGE